MNIMFFLKLYTLPILALFFGFGLYYLIFVGTNKQDSLSQNQQSIEVLMQKDAASSVAKESSKDTLAEQDLLGNESILSQNPDVSIHSNSKIHQDLQPTQKTEIPIDEEKPHILTSKPQVYIVVPKVINVRSEPNESSRILLRLLSGNNVEVQYIKDGWAKTKDGWVLARLLKEKNDAATKEITQNPSQEQVANANEEKFETYIVVPKVINVRSEPNESSRILLRLLSGNNVEVQYIKDGWAKTKDGWVLARLLKKQE